MIEAILFVGLLALGLCALYGAFGRDERDNMGGGCRSAAARML